MSKQHFKTVDDLNKIIAHLPANLVGIDSELRAIPLEDGSYELEYPDKIQKILDKIDADASVADPVPPRIDLLNLRIVAKTDKHGDTTTFEQIEQAIAAIADPVGKATAEEVWRGGGTIARDSSTFANITKAAKLKQKDVDELFRRAHSLIL